MAGEAEGEGLVFHPMDQFIVKPLFGEGPIQWYTPTNATLWMAVTILMVALFFVVGTGKRSIVPSRIQSIAELGYGFVKKMVEDVSGHDGVKYFPYIFTLFCFIVFSNFLGLIPGAFTTTSHIAVTAILAVMVFLFVTILGFAKNGMHFLGLFWVSSAPLALLAIGAAVSSTREPHHLNAFSSRFPSNSIRSPLSPWNTLRASTSNSATAPLRA